jgi:hypothetical protein
MSEKRTPAWSNLQLLTLAACFLVASGVFHLAHAAAGKSFYRDQHLGAALEYAKNRIDLFRPIIVGFNANQTPTPLELPLWQALTALAFRIFGPWFGWANLTSLLLFSTCPFPLYQLAKIRSGPRCACWTLVFFLSQPLIFFYAGVAGTDGFSIAGAIWFLFFAVKLLQQPCWIWWSMACASGIVAALSKLPFFMATGLAVFFLVVTFHRDSLPAWLLMGGVAICVGAVFLAWTVYTNRCFARAELPHMDLRISTPGTFFWWFGDWHYRLSPFNWAKGAWRLLNACFGGVTLAGLFMASLVFLRQDVFAKLWLAGAIITTLIFTHVVLHHWHYYLMFAPAIALISAQAAQAWEKHLVFESRWKARLGLGIIAVSLLLSVAEGLAAMKTYVMPDPYHREIVKIIKLHSKTSDKLLIQGGGWGGEELFLANREGLSVWDTQLLENRETYRRLKELGYTRLVMITESPLLVAAQAGVPGGNGLVRASYRQFMTPVVEKWPTLYQDENILIKTIP